MLLYESVASCVINRTPKNRNIILSKIKIFSYVPVAMIRQAIALASAFSGGFACSYYINQRNSDETLTIPDGLPIFSKLLRDISLEAESPSITPLSPANALAPVGPSGVSKDTSSIARPNRLGEIMRHGYPSLDNLRIFDNYILSYDRRNRVANWVFEHLKPAALRSLEDTDRGKSEFKEDDQIHPYFRSTNQDYKGLVAAQQSCPTCFFQCFFSVLGSGYDR
jgi:hypothetical protein